MTPAGDLAQRRRTGRGGERAFSLVELIVVIVIISILVAVAVPVFLSSRSSAKQRVCQHNQRSIESALVTWRVNREDRGGHLDDEFVTAECEPGDGEAYIDLDGNVPGPDPSGPGSRSLADQFAEGHGPFDCSSNGTGAGQVDGRYDYITDGIAVACLTDNHLGLKADGTPFVHDRALDVAWNHSRDAEEVEIAKLTPLGDTFGDISAGMIDLIMKFYEKHGRYPRSWGDYVYTDIGLNPEDWKKPIGNIYYKPGGNRVSIAPEAGYALRVIDSNGKERVLPSKNNWNLVYDLATGTWYYHSVNRNNAIDIRTLKVVKE